MNETKLHPSTNILVLFMALSIGAIIAVVLGKDLDFDLANYHFYNGYALWHQRWSENYWPPSYIHMYFPPTADLLSYLLITNFPSLIAVATIGAIHGINLWLIFNIAYQFVPKNYFPALTAFGISILGFYGPLGFLGIGNFKNDHIVSIFVLLSVWLQLKFWQEYVLRSKINYRILMLASLVLGMGAQLKLTGNTYILAACLSCIILPIAWLKKIKIFVVSILFIAIGSLISSGYWMYIQWIRFRNPVFPFLNQIFRSIDYPSTNFRYVEFQPDSWWQTIFYPFYFSFHGTIPEASSRDFRYLIVYMLLLMLIGLIFFRKLTNQSIVRMPLANIWLIFFCIFSYVICMAYFGALRYIIALEMLAPIIILLLTEYLFAQHAFIITSILYLFIFCTMSPGYVGTRVAWWHGQNYFDVKLPNNFSFTDEAMVLLPYTMYARSNDPRPQTYLIPYLPKNWHYVGIPFHREKFIPPTPRVTEKILGLLTHFRGKFYVLTSDSAIVESYRASQQFGLQPAGRCEKISTQREFINTRKVVICPMQRVFPLTSYRVSDKKTKVVN